ncbi:hypothetical protein [Aestuariimicrobium ganziense]|uniref:hypothetical protein n=1 Tax=Aestuariimicrobium ganziense TaxID=2773677 RepID=UPI001945ABFF|nr:hypothetical protein [Aestuariimicrobium ganziense]
MASAADSILIKPHERLDPWYEVHLGYVTAGANLASRRWQRDIVDPTWDALWASSSPLAAFSLLANGWLLDDDGAASRRGSMPRWQLALLGLRVHPDPPRPPKGWIREEFLRLAMIDGGHAAVRRAALMLKRTLVDIGMGDTPTLQAVKDAVEATNAAATAGALQDEER